MNEKTGTKPHRRIVVTVDAESNLPPAIEMAVTLAAATQSALHGLFVQDVDLISVARLPFTQEITLLGGQPRTLDDQQLLRALDKLAGEFRQSLERQARRRALDCSYSVVQGRKHSMDLGESPLAQFVILGQPGRGEARVAGIQRIVMLMDRCAELLPALEAVLEKTRGMHTELVLLGRRDEIAETAESRLSKLLERHPDVVPLVLPAEQLPQLLQSRSPRVDCVITSRRTDPLRLQLILQLASCPVIVASDDSPPGNGTRQDR